MLGLVSTWMGDRLGTPDAVGISFFNIDIRNKKALYATVCHLPSATAIPR